MHRPISYSSTEGGRFDTYRKSEGVSAPLL